ncbi:hypothetical protein D3C81_1197630 [compost metagenome]
MVEQPGQTVCEGQGAQPALVVGQLDRQLIAHPAQGQRVQRQHRQAGIDLQGRGVQLQAGAERQDGDKHAGQLGQRPAHEHPLAAGSDVIHGHHRQHGHTGQRVELHGGGPEPAHQRIEQQVALFCLIRGGRAASPEVGHVRPQQPVEQHQPPYPGRRRQRSHAGHDAEQADAQAYNAWQVDALDECKAFAAAVVHHAHCSSAGVPFIA